MKSEIYLSARQSCVRAFNSVLFSNRLRKCEFGKAEGA